MKIAVLDIGGTSIKSGIFENDSLVNVKEYDTNAKFGGIYVINKVKEILRGYESFDRIGISTAGQVDFAKGEIKYANSNIPGYTGMKIRSILEDEFKVPVAVENDVNAAAIGEANYGSGKDENDFLCLTYGTGVGGAIVINKDVYRGSSFSAAEMGAIVIQPKDRNSEEDMYSGCYEKYASVTALVKNAILLDSSLDSGRRIFERIDDVNVRCVVDQWIEQVVLGLVSIVHIFNPSLIVLGGGVMKQEYVVEEINKHLKKEIMKSFRSIKVVPAFLGNNAGMYGAANCALNIRCV